MTELPPNGRSPTIMRGHSDMLMCDEHTDGIMLNETVLRTPANEGEVSPDFLCFLFWVQLRRNSYSEPLIFLRSTRYTRR